MSGMMMLDRPTMMGAMGTPGAMQMGQMTGMPGMMPGMGMCVVPRCTMEMEKCAGGMKITCKCDDEMSAATLQNMCKMMAGGLCSLCCMMNGTMLSVCNMAMCKCECTMTKDGVCITCVSGDKACCEMIEACCDCMCACMNAGCTCCVCFNNMPLCCGCC